MGSMYSASTVPIEDLAAMQAAALKIRLQMRYIQALHEQERAADLVADIGKEQKKLDVAWRDYYPAKIATTDERRLADRVAKVLAAFRTQSDDIVEVLRSGNLDMGGRSACDPARGRNQRQHLRSFRRTARRDRAGERRGESHGSGALRNNAAVVEQAAQAALSLEDQVAAQRCAIAVFEVRSQACGTAT
ncbi:hypothetical protein OKW40_007170 [Paraburkholderia sp. RAU6.4a]